MGSPEVTSKLLPAQAPQAASLVNWIRGPVGRRHHSGSSDPDTWPEAPHGHTTASASADKLHGIDHEDTTGRQMLVEERAQGSFSGRLLHCFLCDRVSL